MQYNQPNHPAISTILRRDMRELFLYGHHGGSNLNVINSGVQIELEFQLTTTIATSFNILNYLHSDCVKHKSIR
jgi:hypothetical protein